MFHACSCTRRMQSPSCETAGAICMTRLREMCACIDSFAHQQFSRLCHADAQTLPTANLPIFEARLCFGAPFGIVMLLSKQSSIFLICTFTVLAHGVSPSQTMSGRSHSSRYPSSRCPPASTRQKPTSYSPHNSPFSTTFKSITVCRSFGTDAVFCKRSPCSPGLSIVIADQYLPGVLHVQLAVQRCRQSGRFCSQRAPDHTHGWIDTAGGDGGGESP